MEKEFLQSDEWASFQQSIGRKVFKIDAGEISSLVIEQDWFFGKKFLYVPRGPIGAINKENIKVWKEKLTELGLKEKAVFAHIEPPWGMTLGGETAKWFFENGFAADAGKKIQPLATYLLDTSLPEEALLSNMARGMRYNIKYTEKNNIEARTDEGEQAKEIFLQTMKKAEKNIAFKAHSADYYAKMFTSPMGKFLKTISLSHKGEIISSTVFVFYNNRATALHTFALPEAKQLKCLTYALWLGILLAKKLGFGKYDFWGAESEENANTKLGKISMMKKYFGASFYRYADPLALVFDKKYYLLWKTAKKITSILKR